MDWLLGCFRCEQRRQRCPSAHVGREKDAHQVCVTDGLVRANITKEGSRTRHKIGDPAVKNSESSKITCVSSIESATNSSGSVKAEFRHHSTSEQSSDRLSIVERLEKEFDNLNENLVVADTSHARILTNETKHLRQSNEFLDSSDSFKRALEAFKNTPEKGKLEESQPFLHLRSLASTIGITEEIAGTFLEKAMDASIVKIPSKESSSHSSYIEKKHESISTQDVARLPSDHLQMDSIEDLVGGPELKNEHLADITTCHSSLEVMTTKNSDLISVRKRRSPGTYSFSGFIVIEDELEDRTASAHVISECCRSLEASVMEIIETPDATSDNLVETSKSLFAFARSSSESHSSLMEKSLSSGFEDFSLVYRDSEVEISIKGQDAGQTMYQACESPDCLHTENTWVSCGPCVDTSISQSQVETSEDSYDGFSDVSCHKCIGLSDRTSYIISSSKEIENLNESRALQQQVQVALVKDEESVMRHVNSCFHAQLQDIDDAVSRNLNFADFGTSTEGRAADTPESVGLAEEFRRMDAYSFDGNCASVFGPGKASAADGRAICLESNKLPESHTYASDYTGLSEKRKCIENTVQCMGSPTTCDILQAEDLKPFHDSSTDMYMKKDFSMSSLSPDPLKPLKAVSSTPLVCLDGAKHFSEIPSTPVSVDSHASLVPFSKDNPCRLQITHLMTSLPSFSHAETPNSISRRSSFIGEDRPILGTVAAHWNHSSSSTKKWWDGKGIPNSTNKYKEDQKVSWHATPFEVRLERALAKQGRAFQKKLFIGAAEMEVSS